MLIAVVAFISVGLTAPADGPFSIDVRPVFLRLDAESVSESRARALGLDVDIKVGTLHQRIEFFENLVARLRAVPGVEHAGAISFLPLPGPVAATGFTIVEQPEPMPGQAPTPTCGSPTTASSRR